MNESSVCEDVVVPESGLLRRECRSGYGSVPGLDDAELASPDELEREVMLEEWGPVLALPVKGEGSSIRPVVDEAGGVDWGAFGTVDFERYRGGFDKVRYKADKLREQLKDLMIRIGLVKERLPGKAKYVVLKYLKMGAIKLEHVGSFDMLCLARLWQRAQRLRDEIRRLDEVSEGRMRRRFGLETGCVGGGFVELWLVGLRGVVGEGGRSG